MDAAQIFYLLSHHVVYDFAGVTITKNAADCVSLVFSEDSEMFAADVCLQHGAMTIQIQLTTAYKGKNTKTCILCYGTCTLWFFATQERVLGYLEILMEVR